MRFRHIATVLAELMIIVAAAHGPALGDPVQGDAELLKTVALQHKANLESLLTWKGEAVEEITATQGHGYDCVVQNHVTFAFDQVRNAVRWNKDPQPGHHLVVEGSAKDDFQSFNSRMVVDDKTFSYASRGRTADGKPTQNLVIGGIEQAANWDAFHFDPRRLLANPGSGNPLHQDLICMYDDAQMPATEESKARKFERKVTRAGELVTVDTQMNLEDGSGITDRQVFDLSRGGNLVERSNKYRSAENVYTYDYEEKAGVWVPKSFKWVNVAFREGGDLRTTRTVKWDKSVVNVPFEEDEFTLPKLGVKPGDEITDHRIGVVYRYKDGLQDAELLHPALLAVKDANETGSGRTAPLARVPGRTNAGADANIAAPEGTNASVTAGLPTPEGVEVIAAARGMHRWFYVLVLAVVVGFGAIVYKFTRKFAKERNQCPDGK